jgi:hypothetical protein
VSRTGIISLLLFVAIMGYFLSMSAEHAQTAGRFLPVARAISHDRFGPG